MRVQSRSLLERVARTIAQPRTTSPACAASLLARVASAYSAQPVIDDGEGLGDFDAGAAALFEAVVEAAFLVANADGIFDADERAAFQTVVAAACDNVVQLRRLEALTADFAEQLAEDGVEKRVLMVARTIAERDQQLEVLRIAGLMAHVSGGVSDVERRVIGLLADGFGLELEDVDETLAQAADALELG